MEISSSSDLAPGRGGASVCEGAKIHFRDEVVRAGDPAAYFAALALLLWSVPKEMNDDEKELLKAGADAAIRPFANLIEKLFGGAVEEIGGGWKDKLGTRRKIRQIKLLKKLQGEIQRAGFEPRQIPDNIWIPSFAEALQQDDETLQEKWAALLARAADPNKEMIPQSFPRILAELSPMEVRFLDRLYKHLAEGAAKYKDHEEMGFTAPLKRERLADIYIADQCPIDEFAMTIDNLLRVRLLVAEAPPLDRDEFLAGRVTEDNEIYRLTSLGYAFLAACRTREG